MKIKCQKCKIVWDYSGDKKPSKNYSQYVACPRCRTSVRLEEYRDEEN